ncbi:MAG TPA: hypothetical protein VHB99_10870 [Pirellulales bacterium]|nr:hypothetical protein [Pirellulales bacterium]
MQRCSGVWAASVAGCLVAFLSGCEASAPPASILARLPAASADEFGEADESAADREFARRLLEIADEYLEYTLIDPGGQIAVGACSAPQSEFIPPRFSNAEENAAHGKQLYFLFARDTVAYSAAGDSESSQPIGQAIVKESWAAREIHDGRRPRAFTHRSGAPVRLYAECDGRTFGADRQMELFVMLKLPPDVPGTDSGWIYGTVSPDLRRVTSVGRIASCVECHEQAAGDRLFGGGPQEALTENL